MAGFVRFMHTNSIRRSSGMRKRGVVVRGKRMFSRSARMAKRKGFLG